jgi:hypothetical protein
MDRGLYHVFPVNPDALALAFDPPGAFYFLTASLLSTYVQLVNNVPFFPAFLFDFPPALT